MHPVALEPGIVGAGSNAFSAAEIPDGGVTSEPFEHDADLLFSSELAAGNAFDIPDKALRFFSPGFGLPELL